MEYKLDSNLFATMNFKNCTKKDGENFEDYSGRPNNELMKVNFVLVK